MTAMKRILLGLTQPQHDRLRRRAADRHVSVAKLVREAVEQVYPDEAEARLIARERAEQVGQANITARCKQRGELIGNRVRGECGVARGGVE